MYSQSNNFSYYPQTPAPTGAPMYRPQYLGMKGHPVSSLEEARAATIDFDGSIFFFPDLANKKIYTKQINMDGTMSLCVYSPVETPLPNNENYVTKEELEAAISQLRNQLAPAPTAPTVQAPAQKPVQEFKF